MLIYVAGPYSAPTHDEIAANIARAEEAGKKLIQSGMIPVIPHRITGHWEEDPTFEHWSHQDWMDRFCIPLLNRCDAVLMLPGWENSKGTLMELEQARAIGKPIVFSDGSELMVQKV